MGKRNRKQNKTNKRNNKVNNNKKRGFKEIKPHLHQDSIDESQVEQYQSQYENMLLVNNSETQSIERAIHEVVYLENTSSYFTQERMNKWGLIFKQTRSLSRVLIYSSVARDIPKTLGLTQGEYFDKYFGLPDYEVSKALRTVNTLLYLKWGITSYEEGINRPNLLLELGDESDSAIHSLSTLMKKHSPEHAVKVFTECQELVAKKDSVKKITEKLVKDVNHLLLKELELNKTISNGAKDEYKKIDHPSFDDANHCFDKPASDEIVMTVANLEEGHAHIKDIISNIDSYTSNDLNTISKALSKLQLIATS